MFGLTRREQRWKAEQKAAETIAGVLVAAVNAKSHRGEEMNKSEQLIACLEGEIAKRDARIVEISAAYTSELDELAGRNYALRMENARLLAELAATPAAPAADAGLVEALEIVAQWKLPETGQFWPSGSPVSYEAQWGSKGARDYMRGVAQAALAAHRAKGVA